MNAMIESATALRPLFRAQAATIEESRRLPEAVLNAVHSIQGFNLQLTPEFDGPALEPVEYLHVLEELCRGDASTGWCAMVGTESNACVNAFLHPQVVRDMISANPRQTVALTVVGSGQAIETDGGYRISGRWRFASGCRHATWLASMCVVHDANGPCSRANGAPLTRIVFSRASEAIFHDTWNTSGLRGTASDDFELVDVLVPTERSFDLATAPLHGSPAWRIPLTLRLAMSKAAAVCGMARGAMDALRPLLDRTPFAGALPAREEPHTQISLARAEAALESGRAYLYQNVEQAWQAVLSGEVMEVNDIARVRLAIVWAAECALQSLHLMQDIAGTSAVLDPAFDRAARDLEVARHHMQLQTHVTEDVGRVLVGMAPRNPLF